jgi:4-hydroxybenzoyl-CoA thioesterase/acyl-CoA thioester hydrolase
MTAIFHTRRRIEFVDVDLAGFVHFSRFFIFMETAEHEFLRSLGTSVHSHIDGDEIGWPRLAASCEYLHPARFEDVLDIQLIVKRKGNSSMTYEFLFHRTGKLIAKGEVSSICCKIHPQHGLQPIPIPAFIGDRIRALQHQTKRSATKRAAIKTKSKN